MNQGSEEAITVKQDRFYFHFAPFDLFLIDFKLTDAVPPLILCKTLAV